jgi:hypothetical protein
MLTIKTGNGTIRFPDQELLERAIKPGIGNALNNSRMCTEIIKRASD